MSPPYIDSPYSGEYNFDDCFDKENDSDEINSPKPQKSKEEYGENEFKVRKVSQERLTDIP